MHKTILLQLILVLFAAPMPCYGAAVTYLVDLEGLSLEHGIGYELSGQSRST